MDPFIAKILGDCAVGDLPEAEIGRQCGLRQVKAAEVCGEVNGTAWGEIAGHQGKELGMVVLHIPRHLAAGRAGEGGGIDDDQIERGLAAAGPVFEEGAGIIADDPVATGILESVDGEICACPVEVGVGEVDADRVGRPPAAAYTEKLPV